MSIEIVAVGEHVITMGCGVDGGCLDCVLQTSRVFEFGHGSALIPPEGIVT